MGSNIVTNVASPSASTDAANKQYVDEVAQGLKAAPAVEVATTANLTATYSNGTAGVGATLTSTSNGAFPTIDGITVDSTAVGLNGVLVKNQSTAAENGRYNLTQVGDGSTPWILTRCGVCDQASEIPGSYVFVKAGTTQEATGWVAYVADPDTFTVGTDNITYFQFSGAGTYTAGTGITLTGTQFSIPQEVGTSSNVQFGSLGIGTAASGTAGEILATNAITAYYSDDRLKTRTGNIQNALEKVLSLDGFHYYANETAVALGYDSSKQEVGLSAQQVKAVLPEVIAPAPIDPQYMTMHYDRLVPLLVEAIKEQQKQIEELKAKLGN
jgi:hypothetical protein